MPTAIFERKFEYLGEANDGGKEKMWSDWWNEYEINKDLNRREDGVKGGEDRTVKTVSSGQEGRDRGRTASIFFPFDT